MLKYHIFWWAPEKSYTSINFPGGRKNWTIAIFGIHYIKVSSLFMSLQLTYKIFMIQDNCNDHVKFHRDLLIRSTSKFSICFFAIFLVPSDPWVLYLRTGWSHKNFIQSCRSKSKIIMCLWSVALKARKAAKWPRTFYMVWVSDSTVESPLSSTRKKLQRSKLRQFLKMALFTPWFLGFTAIMM